MKDLPSRGFSELEVKNFGPIVEAKIDLRPLTVLVGPSNTGKSYLAILLYALHRFLSEGSLYGDPFLSSGGVFRRGGERKLSKREFDALSQWAEKAFGETELPKTGIALDPISDLIRSTFTESDEEVGQGLSGEIGRCFGIGNEIGNLVRKESGDDMRVVFRKPVPNDSESFVRSGLTVSRRGVSNFSTAIPEEMSMRLGPEKRRNYGFMRHMAMDLLSSSGGNGRKREYGAWRLIDALASSQLPGVFGPLHLPAFYLPADRTGVMHGHNVVVSALIKSAAMAGVVTDIPTPTLSGVLADFLQQLISLGNKSARRYRRRGRRGSRNNLGERFEKKVLRGSVHTDESEAGYPSFTYQPQGWKVKLPLMNASSMVSELAPVVLYLRHIVLPEDLLVVEEPESHLHPAMQVEFARQLAAVVNSGVRVIITTHSECLLGALANLVKSSELHESRKRKTGEDDAALRPDQVGVWLFQPKQRPKGSIVKEVPLDEESGLFPSGFSDVTVALYNEWADISNRIEERR